jgi:hypothetical protein
MSIKEWRFFFDCCFGSNRGPGLYNDLIDRACGVHKSMMSRDITDQVSAAGFPSHYARIAPSLTKGVTTKFCVGNQAVVTIGRGKGEIMLLSAQRWQ